MNIQWILALRYLNGRKLRTFLTTLAVIFGVLVIFSINIMLPTMLRSFEVTMLAASNQVDLTISHRSQVAFDSAVLNEVKEVEGVRVAQGLLSRPINLPADHFDNNAETPDRVNILTLVGLEPETAQEIRAYLIQEGRFLQSGDANRCVIAASLADNLGLHLGDSLTLPTTKGLVDLEIVGIQPPRAIPGNEEVLVTLPTAQSLFSQPGKYNTIEVNYNTTEENRRAEIEQAVEGRLGDTYQFGALSSGTDIFASLNVAQSILNVVGMLALFMGAFIIFNTFRTLIAERRRDIGMLRAVGASRRTILGIVLTEGLIQGGVGTLLGMAIGYVLGGAGMMAVSPMVENFVRIKIDAPVVSPTLVITTIILGVGVTLLAGLIPAVSATRVTPLEAIRPPTAEVVYRRTITTATIIGIILIALSILALVSGQAQIAAAGALVFMLGLVLVAPALVQPIAKIFGAIFVLIMARQGTGFLAQGNLTRQPGRAAVTASTSMIALAILVVAGGLTTTLENTFLGIMKKSLGSDYLFIPPSVAIWANDVGAQSDFAQQLRDVEGVEAVSTMRFATSVVDMQPAMPAKGQPATTNGIAVSLLGIDPQDYPKVSGFEFTEGDDRGAYQALANERALIANGVFMSTSGLKVGDLVPLITPEGLQNYRLVAVGTDFMNIKVVTAFISQANLERDFGKTEDIFIQLNLVPGTEPESVEAQLKTIKQNYPQFNMISGQLYFDQMSELFKAAFASMFIVFIFLAVPSLIAMINTLAISVIERTREIGMIRAVGATQKQIRAMVLAEALLLAGIGVAFGLLGGLYLGYALVGAFKLGGFPVEYYFPWAGMIYAIAVGLIFGALAAIVPARQAARLDIIEALRYE